MFFKELEYKKIDKMPTWNQIQAQLRGANNPVVFFDVSVGTTVSNIRNFMNKIKIVF